MDVITKKLITLLSHSYTPSSYKHLGGILRCKVWEKPEQRFFSLEVN